MDGKLRSLLLLAMMVAASGLAVVLRPNIAGAGTRAEYRIDAVVPMTFGEWTASQRAASSFVDPQQQEALDRIYTQVLNRTYQHSRTGHTVMLSVAFGSDQTKRDQVHRPEVCYPAQGFQILSAAKADLELGSNGRIRATRLVARAGNRNEPITYWVRIGDRIVRGSVEQKVAIVKEGLVGRVPSGMLVRVSSIGADAAAEHAVQAEFVRELIASLAVGARKDFIGVIGSS